MLGADLALGANDAEEAKARVRVIGAVLREEELRGLAQKEVAPPVVREIAFDEGLLVGERDEARAAARKLDKRGVEVGETQV